MDVLSIVVGLLLGVLGSLLFFWHKLTREKMANEEKRVQIINLDQELNSREQEAQSRAAEILKGQDELKQMQAALHEALRDLSIWKVRFADLEIKLKEDKEQKGQQDRQLENQFKVLAAEVLKQNSADFAEKQQKSIAQILNPLREKIGDFEKKINESYDKDLRDRISLKEEVKKLHEMNKIISVEASNLTKALKGDVKTQGNWGEMILERVLEVSGLTKGEEYEVQVSDANADGRRVQPDVVIHLPDKKRLIIDAKVSLIAYERYVQATTDEERQRNLNEHVASVRRHIKDLSAKQYESIEGLITPEFVLLFMPIEPSFGLAIREDIEIFTYAWENRIILVCPTTLLATLKTVASLWKQEKQNRNAEKIARESGLLYDKFAGLLKDIEAIGQGIDKSRSAYESACRKLTTGPGNLIGKVENMKKLGAKSSKAIDEKWLPMPEDEGVGQI